MKASDIYGALEFTNAITQDETLPDTSGAEAEVANSTAKRKKSWGGNVMIASLVIVGILIGAKYALEK